MNAKQLNKEQAIPNKIDVLQVYSENGTVYLKASENNASTKINNRWFPINFHWKPVLELQHDMSL